ncbi:unnamed protein product [Effrenium voratum]|nr:unnamed protein product [Effrenium voratum]
MVAGICPVSASKLPLRSIASRKNRRFDTISASTFGNQFVGRVANPDEVLLFHRRGGAGGAAGTRKVTSLGDVLEIEENLMPGDDGVKIQDIIYKYIDGEQNLQVLPEPDLNDAAWSPRVPRVRRVSGPEICWPNAKAVALETIDLLVCQQKRLKRQVRVVSRFVFFSSD